MYLSHDYRLVTLVVLLGDQEIGGALLTFHGLWEVPADKQYLKFALLVHPAQHLLLDNDHDYNISSYR